MLPIFIIFVSLLFLIHPPVCSAATDTISAGEALIRDQKLVSRNGRFALGFFQPDTNSKFFPRHTPKHWYIGIWFDKVSRLTPIWIANRENPIVGHHRVSKLTIADNGNLVIFNQATRLTVWSTHATITTKNTMAVLQDNGNLILADASNSSNILWQSFDYLTDVIPLDAKFGRDNVSGLNRHLVSKKSLTDPSAGLYCLELDPTGADQFVLKLCNSSVVYWSTGVWNGQIFNSMPEMSGRTLFDYKFINNKQEKYFLCTLLEQDQLTICLLHISGQMKQLIWLERKQEWATIYTLPKDLCDIYATCGPFTICNSNALSVCDCMKGFSVKSPKDWELEDRTGGCIRNTPLDCGVKNQSRTATTDKFYPLPGVGLPTKANIIVVAGTAEQCELACLNNCSCTAYSYGNRCSVWYDDLLNVRQYNNGTTSDGGILYLRIAAKDAESWIHTKSGKGKIIGAVVASSVVVLGLLSSTVIWVLVIWRNKRKQVAGSSDNVQGGNGIVAFRYTDLQRATKNFSEKLGGGSFGAVFKGFLGESTTIAVKRLDGDCQGEKQFRAEVSSIGIIQHINLVKLIGFCCESGRRLLVYEHMPNCSLDMHLFHDNTMILNWSTRYQIALGVAKGLAYLHESCRDCIIHCDIKPENILLDGSFVPKIADFGMAKFVGRDFSRVITTFRGTIGYLAPEWISGVAITSKVDVYSYGMVLSEIISGRRNSCEQNISDDDHVAYFPVQVANKLLEGDIRSLLDKKLLDDVNMEEAARVCKVACWCIQDNESHRPTMGQVVQILEGLLELEMPPMPRLLEAVTGSSY
uniref:Receptor-like serine/threonine-protein kinase n=1 Tax=Leersia perrieri TaxID=77586 RepID=A0A0D9WD66_9ORYZ